MVMCGKIAFYVLVLGTFSLCQYSEATSTTTEAANPISPNSAPKVSEASCSLAVLSTDLSECIILGSGSCRNKKPIDGNPLAYHWMVGNAIYTIYCPSGTVFRESDCICDHDDQAGTDCKAEVHIDFNETVRNNNPNVALQSVNVGLVNNTGAFFSDKSKITIWRFSGYQFQKGMTAKFSFKAPQEGRNRIETLLGTCNNNDKTEPSLSITLNRTDDLQQVNFVVMTRNTGNKLITLDAVPDEWNTVTMKFDNKYLRVSVNSQRESLDINGGKLKKASGMTIGRCDYFNNFRGYIDDLYIYICSVDI